MTLRRPQTEETMTVPACAGHRLGDLRKAAIGRPVPGEALFKNHHPLWSAVPFANEQRAWLKADPIACRWPPRLERTAVGSPVTFAIGQTKAPQRRLVEIAERCDLQAIGEQAQQQPARQVGRRYPAQVVSPLEPKLFGVAIAKTGYCGFESPCPARGRTMDAIASHAVRDLSRRDHAALSA